MEKKFIKEKKMKPVNQNNSPLYKNVLQTLACEFTKIYGTDLMSDNIDLYSVQKVNVVKQKPNLRIVKNDED